MDPHMLCFFAFVVSAAAIKYPGFLFRDQSGEKPRVYLGDDAGEKLILTSYIEAGQIAVARNLSKVTGEPFPDDIPSFSGFFTVNKKYDSNLFFWFFPAEEDYENAPVILWLQGGPGASSLLGLFTEVGPFYVSQDGSSLIRNAYSWHKNHSIIFIDSPAGSGFSYTMDEAGYVRNQTDVAEQLYSALVQFFTMFPELQKNNFFIGGESYAGKYVPAIGRFIHEKNSNASLWMNMKGIFIGDGLVNPVDMIHYSDMVYQWGLVDLRTKQKLQQYEDLTLQYVATGEYDIALEVMGYEDDIVNHLGVSVYNLMTNSSGFDDHYAKLLEEKNVRVAIHVGDQPYYPLNMTVNSRLSDNYLVSARPWVEQLLNSGYRVLFYNGQLDIICGYSLTVKLIENLHFNSAEEYKTASRKIWRLDSKVAGYTKTAGNMTEVMVRNAGHAVPADQPAAAFHLIYSFTRDILQ